MGALRRLLRSTVVDTARPLAGMEAPDSLRSPFVFDIAAGVRREDTALQAQIDRVLVARRADIRDILNRYGVPLAGKART